MSISFFRRIAAAALALPLALAAPAAFAQKEQFIPAMFYRIGAYAPGGSGISGGMLDYLSMRSVAGRLSGR
ncbi:MAG: hypothetical protein EPO20_17675 [Betaproteobacteria bacterium]|nr:MAG: hypothetical protein EPO20_17675 [Betaproteobacteria bacterium]